MSVVKSAITVSIFTFCSRILGFLRECAIAAFIGSNMFSDCFLIAFKLANTFRRIFAEGAFNASFLPRFSRVLENEGIDAANDMLSKIFSIMVMSISILAVFIMIFYPNLINILASGFVEQKEKFDLAVTLGRILFPFLLFISLTALFCCVSNAIGKFALPTIIYALVNVFLIIAMLFGYAFNYCPFRIVHIMSWFILLSGITQLVIMILYTKKSGFVVRFTFNIFSPKVNDVMRHMIPGIIGAGIWQINLLVDTKICSYLPSGSITCLNLADRLNQFPLATLGTALSTALLPILSNAISKKDDRRANFEFQSGLLFAMLIALPFAICLYILSEQAVAVAFQRGMFSHDQVFITALALRAFVIGVPAYVITKIFSSAYFAHGNTSGPIKTGMVSVFFNIIFLLLLIPFGKYYCIALSTSLAAFVNAILLIVGLRKKYDFSIGIEFMKKFTAQVLACIALFFSLKFVGCIMWHPSMGESATKLLYAVSMILFSTCCYWMFLCIFLRILGYRSSWNIWSPRIWTIGS